MSKYSDRKLKARLLLLLFAFLGAYSLLMARNLSLLLKSDDRLASLDNRQRDYKQKISSHRGTIYDRNGRILAVSLKVPSVFVDPAVFEPSPQQLSKLSKILELSERDIKNNAKKGARHFAWMKRFLDPGVEIALKDLKLNGVHTLQEWKRFYPEKYLAGQIIGTVGKDGYGLEGIEKMYDGFLRSKEAVIEGERDARGRTFFIGDDEFKESKAGASLYLTIDTAIQYQLEEELRQAGAETNSETGFGIVMDPKNGKVLAMATYPSVDPNHPEDFPLNSWRNRPIQEVFEPGSTFKVFTLAAALESGTLKPKDNIYCAKGSLVVNNKTIRNDSEKGDWLSPKSILQYSNNIGAARIGMGMGALRFAKSMEYFGFGHRTGIEFPGEPKGLFSNPNSWKALELANISFGQGIGVTALQVITGISLIANGGMEIKPRLIDQLAQPSQLRIEQDNSEDTFQRILSDTTTKQLTDWMSAVVEEGTGKRAAIPGYTVAGKTGTAQMVDPETGKYARGKYTSSFVGFIPAANPKLSAMIVFRGNHLHGGEVAAPVFQKVMANAVRYLRIAPDANDYLAKPSVAEAYPIRIPKAIRRLFGEKEL